MLATSLGQAFVNQLWLSIWTGIQLGNSRLSHEVIQQWSPLLRMRQFTWKRKEDALGNDNKRSLMSRWWENIAKQTKEQPKGGMLLDKRASKNHRRDTFPSRRNRALANWSWCIRSGSLRPSRGSTRPWDATFLAHQTKPSNEARQ